MNNFIQFRKIIMRYVLIIFLLVAFGCAQVENPLEPEDVKSAPVVQEFEPIIDCSEPAYLISVSPETGTVIDKDTLITLTFNCSPNDLSMLGEKPTGYTRRRFSLARNHTVEYKFEYNRNIATIDFKILPLDQWSATYTMDFEFKWQNGRKTLSYDIYFPEIEGAD